MKEKKWIDCPSCGSKGSMKLRKSISETYRNPDYKPITVDGLEGYFCAKCGDGIFTIQSTKRIISQLADDMARQDSKRVVASDILDVETVAKQLSVSRQRVHQMMKEGKISYVYVGRYRFPINRKGNIPARLKKAIQRHSGK